MTRNKTLLLTFLMAFSTILPIQAQQKLFTLEDLNFGGNNFYNLLPKNLYLTWWGDKLMYLDAEEGGLHHADGTRSVSFQLSELGSDWHSAYEAEYPYADKPLVLLDNRRQRVLYNFEKHQTEWEPNQPRRDAQRLERTIEGRGLREGQPALRPHGRQRGA